MATSKEYARRLLAKRRNREGKGRAFPLNLPLWLKPKLLPILAVETREEFSVAVASVYPISSNAHTRIMAAYDVVEKEFRGRVRKTGEPVLQHFMSVALILLLHLLVRDVDVIIGGLLNDLPEDIPEWTIERVRMRFGSRVAEFVQGVTKQRPNGEWHKSRSHVEDHYHINLMLSVPRESAIIKLADRLHNLITLWGYEQEKILDKWKETRHFYLVLAAKHGVLVQELTDTLDLIWKRYRLA